MTKTIVRVVMWLMFLVVVAVWAVIGFVLWIPLLVRATTVFSAMLLHATFTRQHPDVLRGHLEAASRFYPDGFRIAYDVINSPVAPRPSALDIRIGRVLAECAWTVIFWTLILMIFHPHWLAPLWAKISTTGLAIGGWLRAQGAPIPVGIAIIGVVAIFGIVVLGLASMMIRRK